MERLGVPTAAIITEPFQGLAARFAGTLGAPDYPPTLVPHPVATKDDGYLRRLAREVADSVYARLTGSVTAPVP